MKPTLHNILSVKNAHPRDANIQFFEEGHKYIILSEPETKYTSVTTWNHSHFPHFDADEFIVGCETAIKRIEEKFVLYSIGAFSFFVIRTDIKITIDMQINKKIQMIK